MGLQDQHIRPHGAGTEQKLLRSQHDVSKELCLPFARLVKKKH